MKVTEEKQAQLSNPNFLLKLNTLGWSLLMGLDFLQNYSNFLVYGMEYPWVNNLAFIIPHFANLWLLTIVVYQIWIRWTASYSGSVLYILLFAGGLLFGFMHITLTSFDQELVLWLLEAKDFPNGFWSTLITSVNQSWSLVIRSLLFYGLILLALTAIDYYARYTKQYVKSAELESQLSNANLRALKMQLHPHFLFNALNTISMMVRRNQNAKAVDMISGLSDMLRGTLWKSDKHLVLLEEELELAKKYLNIEKVRFKDQLEIDISVEKYCLDIVVPNLILLPIIENAFKHGTTKRMPVSRIKIFAYSKNNRVTLGVFNDGPLLPSDFNMKNLKGTGLKNTRDRLEQLYGDSFSFEIANKDTGVAVTIVIPASKKRL